MIVRHSNRIYVKKAQNAERDFLKSSVENPPVFVNQGKGGYYEKRERPGARSLEFS
jgi:hypothetical protein